MDPEIASKMTAQYAPADLPEQVQRAIQSAGLDRTNITLEALADLDQLHVEGQAATTRLAELANISAKDHVLDVCCGMAGPARYLAKTFGCTVVGVDLTEPFLKTAELLNDLTGLSNLVSVEHGDATALRFDDNSFDVYWIQNGAHNIPEKQEFLAEMYRVLKPGGRAVLHEFLRGPGEPIHFPSIFGDDQAAFNSVNFMVSEAEMRTSIEDAGLEVRHWRDLTELSLAANEKMTVDHAAPRAGALDVSLVLGEHLPEHGSNSVKDFQVRSLLLFEAILIKP